MVNQEELQRLRYLITEVEPMEVSCADLVFLTRMMDFLRSGNMLNRYELKEESLPDQLMSIYKNIGEKLKSRFGTYVGSEFGCESTHMIGSVDLLFCDDERLIVIELKTSTFDFKESYYYQTYLYKVMVSLNNNINTKAYLVNLQTGKCVNVYSELHDEFWFYMIEAFCQIDFHYDRIKVEALRKRSEKVIPLNHFVVDTEYIPGKNYIFDLSCLNLNNLYMSIVSPINIPPYYISIALDWINTHVEVNEDSFKYSPELLVYAESLSSFLKKVLKLINTNGLQHRPVFYYYNSLVDVSWLCDYNFNYVDTKDFLSCISKDHLSTSGLHSMACLEDIYSVICLPVEFLNYLHCHTALSDTLLLAELLVCY